MLKNKFPFLTLLLAISTSGTAWASDLTGGQDYYGQIPSIAPGYYGYMGVQLQNGSTCNGRAAVSLHPDNSHYNEIVATLLTAQATNANVKLHAIAANVDGNGFCTISEAAIGNFVGWGATS